ncbi:MAG: 23S rRNA (guanosine(2251)-2'-O)-methyltransferase RlmB [Xanthomonadaceae bacterium]|nr:23S rRNA (guanosine(2251)-2'-O)-methyltransferase RlmB [Xanthomonadaceae bacterium]MDE2177794.1 23S rRNA (guanosine(2251)-2'-O)-methyltransferase RlmB [Xanthomonadaceae bacterium]
MSECWIVGVHPVEAVLSHDPERLLEVLVEQGANHPRVAGLAARAREQGIAVHARTREALERASGEARHQGVAARCREAAPLAEAAIPALVERAGSAALFLALDGVTDPHNLGACLRSAAAAAVTAVIVPKDRASGITPVVRRAAAGAADRVPLVAVSNFARGLRALRDAGVWLVGLAGDGEHSLYALDLKGPLGLVLGGEGDGLRRLSREGCDYLARIPMPGTMESLNVSVATGVALFEAVRQRGGGA